MKILPQGDIVSSVIFCFDKTSSEMLFHVFSFGGSHSPSLFILIEISISGEVMWGCYIHSLSCIPHDPILETKARSASDVSALLLLCVEE